MLFPRHHVLPLLTLWNLAGKFPTEFESIFSDVPLRNQLVFLILSDVFSNKFQYQCDVKNRKNYINNKKMRCKRNAMLPVKKQVNRDICRIEQQFEGGLQHENSVECSGFARYAFHHPIME